MVPDFLRDGVWTPAFARVTVQETFYEIIKGELSASQIFIDSFPFLLYIPAQKDSALFTLPDE